MTGLIFGCGYLGLRVASRWVASGDSVYAVTRTPERADRLRELGLQPVVADVSRPETLADLPAADVVVWSVGMDRTKYDNIFSIYVDGLKSVLRNLPPSTQKLIYVSSTGVYGDFGGDWVNEFSPTEPDRDGGRACLQAEQLIAESSWGKHSTILRFAGIYGPGRIPTRDTIAQQRWSRLTAAGYLNLIQVDDGAAIIQRVGQQTGRNSTYLVSDGHPVLRRDYYAYLASRLGIETIPWQETESDPAGTRAGSNKRIDNRKLIQDYGFKFAFPDYRAGIDAALE